MKNVLKKMAVIVIAVSAMSGYAIAQEKGDMSLGGRLVYGSGDGFSNIGIGAMFRYNVIDPLRLDGSFTYFLKKDYVSMWDLSVNANWLFPVADQITLYPLAGIGILGSKVDLGLDEWGIGTASNSETVINLGGGIDFKLSDKLLLNGELLYKTGSGWNRLHIGAGVAWLF